MNFIHLPMKMEPIVSSETSAIRTQTPGNYPKRNKLQVVIMCYMKFLQQRNNSNLFLLRMPILNYDYNNNILFGFHSDNVRGYLPIGMIQIDKLLFFFFLNHLRFIHYQSCCTVRFVDSL